MRQQIVAGNWKMNNGLEEGINLTTDVMNLVKSEDIGGVKIILACPFIHLHYLSKLCKSSNISIAAQNCHHLESGAYTGEISAAMVKSTGADYVILGHSERRQYFGEYDQLLADKIDAALKSRLLPIFCCGEPFEIRETEQQVDYVNSQLTNSLFGFTADQVSSLIIAYEPIWAIGTGKTASAAQAQEMHASIRQHLQSKYGENAAQNIPILYGGSCKPSNAREIFAGKDVDGGLIGGASLNARDFIDIAKSF